MRRELWELITDLATASATSEAMQAGVHVSSLEIDLPVEVQVQPTEVGFRLFVDVPRSLWTEGLREQPTRMKLNLMWRNGHE